VGLAVWGLKEPYLHYLIFGRRDCHDCPRQDERITEDKVYVNKNCKVINYHILVSEMFSCYRPFQTHFTHFPTLWLNNQCYRNWHIFEWKPYVTLTNTVAKDTSSNVCRSTPSHCSTLTLYANTDIGSCGQRDSGSLLPPGMLPAGRVAFGPSLGLVFCQQHAQHHPISQCTLHIQYTKSYIFIKLHLELNKFSPTTVLANRRQVLRVHSKTFNPVQKEKWLNKCDKHGFL